MITRTRYSYLLGIEYKPTAITADSEALAAQGRRLIFRHGHATQPQSELLIAERDELHSGWVLGFASDTARPYERPVTLTVALNTLSNFVRAARKGCYFDSPDKGYFDGSAEGYWTRVAMELGATAAEIDEITSINLNPAIR